MKHFTKAITAFAIAAITLPQFSCKKSDPVPVEVDVAATLQNKNWKLTALTVSPAISGTTDIYNDFFEACERDDLYRFKANNIFQYDEGAAKCNPANPQTHDGTWNYNTGNKILHFQTTSPGGSVGDAYDLVVTNITDINLVGTMTDVMSGVTYISTWTFTKQ